MDFSPVTLESVQRLSHRILEGHAIRVDLHPYCQPERPIAGHGSVSNDQRWLAYRGSVERTERDASRRVVLRRRFPGAAAANLRRRLRAGFPGLGVDSAEAPPAETLPRRVATRLPPGCHTAEQRKAAERVLRQLQRERPWGAALHAWGPDVSNAGLRIFVLPGEVETEQRITERLGSIANVWFARKFGAHGARGAPP